jgi:hypothetical protein
MPDSGVLCFQASWGCGHPFGWRAVKLGEIPETNMGRIIFMLFCSWLRFAAKFSMGFDLAI